MSTPKISVIIPVYNSEKYLKDSIESILNQTFQNFEIICIDDGSTDSSATIIKNYAEKDQRVKYLYQKNQGPGPARNRGIKEAKGEYISFLDSDDYLEKETLRIVYRIAKKEDLDLVLFNGRPIYESKEIEKKHSVYTNYYKRKNSYEEIMTGEDLLTKQVNNSDFLPHVGFQFIKRSLIIKNKNFFIDVLHEDNLFTIKNLLFAKKAYHLDKEFYVRRLRENSIMTSKMTVQNIHGYFISILKLIELIKQKNFKYETVLTVTKLSRGMQLGASKILTNLENNSVEDYLKTLSDEEILFFDIFFNSVSTKIKENNQEMQKIDQLKEEIKKKQIKIQNKNKTLSDQKDKIDMLNKNLDTVREELKRKNKEIKTIKESKTYKTGKIITYIPREIKNVIKKPS